MAIRNASMADVIPNTLIANCTFVTGHGECRPPLRTPYRFRRWNSVTPQNGCLQETSKKKWSVVQAASTGADTETPPTEPATAKDAVNLGLSLFSKRRVKDALAQFEKALTLDPDPEEAKAALYNKACCHAYRWVLEQQKSEGVTPGENVYIILRLDGRARKSGLDEGFDVQTAGYGLMATYHARNEYCLLSDMQQGFRIFVSIITQLEDHL